MKAVSPLPPSPLELQLAQLRRRLVMGINAAFLLYLALTTRIDPELWGALLAGHWSALYSAASHHSPRYWALGVALLGLLGAWWRPDRIGLLYVPYLLLLLGITLYEMSRLVPYGTAPFHLSLWLIAALSTTFLVYGARGGLWITGGVVGTMALAAAYLTWTLGEPVARGPDPVNDWVTALLVLATVTASLYFLMKLIEDNLLFGARALAELREARLDGLTGVLGRAAAQEALLHACSAAAPLGLLVCDLDHFKRVNDTFGHHLGDRVLRAYAQALSAVLTELGVSGGVVGRWGGEEFVVLLPGVPGEQAVPLAVTLAERAARRTSGELGFGVTASYGLATGNGPLDPRDLFEQADGAMYRAKAAGRNALGLGGGEVRRLAPGRPLPAPSGGAVPGGTEKKSTRAPR